MTQRHNARSQTTLTSLCASIDIAHLKQSNQKHIRNYDTRNNDSNQQNVFAGDYQYRLTSCEAPGACCRARDRPKSDDRRMTRAKTVLRTEHEWTSLSSTDFAIRRRRHAVAVRFGRVSCGCRIMYTTLLIFVRARKRNTGAQHTEHYDAQHRANLRRRALEQLRTHCVCSRGEKRKSGFGGGGGGKGQ